MKTQYERLKALEQMAAAAAKGVVRRHKDEEHRLQVSCVRWFRAQHPSLAPRLFAVPNGGRRDAVTGARLKAEGALPGVSDLIFLKRSARYGALLVEMKTPEGKQSEAQKRWAAAVTGGGEYKYAVCRSLQDFMGAVTDYLNGTA